MYIMTQKYFYFVITAPREPLSPGFFSVPLPSSIYPVNRPVQANATREPGFGIFKIDMIYYLCIHLDHKHFIIITVRK
jgi:hypothetical protein